MSKLQPPQVTPGDWRTVALMPDKLEHHIIAGKWTDAQPIATAEHGGLVAFVDLPANAILMANSKRLAEALEHIEARSGQSVSVKDLLSDPVYVFQVLNAIRTEARAALLASGYVEVRE